MQNSNRFLSLVAFVFAGSGAIACSSDSAIQNPAGSSGAGGNAGSSGAAGTGGSGGTGGGSGGTDAGTCSGDWTAGDYPPGVDDVNAWLTISGVPGQNDLARQYKVHVPPQYDCHVPTPILFCMHGLQQNGVMFCVNGTAGATSSGKGFVDKSNEAGFILVIPTGYMNSWNGAGCCGNSTLDDTALFKAILAEVSTHLNVDSRRVFATGLSNGGYMSYRLACEAADVFTAIAPGSGGLRGIPCTPAKPISVLDIHGTADNLVPYSLQATSMSTIATANGCGATMRAATVPASGGDTTCVTYEACPAGIEVTGCTVQGGGHVWFGDPTCGTGAAGIGCSIVGANSTFLNNTDAVWSFFSRLPPR
jgi:polyhydroxybutyrate depolymerase